MKQSLRFAIFKRDQFICQYCGRTPPVVVLEVDHVQPKSKGGEDGEDNLLTACFDCNRGKAAGLLSQAPPTVSQKAEILLERENQLKAYNRLLAAKRRRENREIDSVQGVFQERFSDREFSARFRESIRGSFLPRISAGELQQFMSKSCERFSDPDKAIRYFCGICWHIIKGKPPRYGSR